MNLPTTTRAGLGLAAATAAISGVSVFVNGLAASVLPDPVAVAAVRNGLVGVALVALAGLPALAGEFAGLDRRRRLGLLALGVIGGGIPFVLFFSGLAAAGGPGAAVIHKTMFLWVALLAVPLLGERVGRLQLAALALLVVGTLLAGPAPALSAGPAAALILGATWLWAVEVVVAKRLLAGVSVRLAAAARMTVGALVIAGWLAANGRLGAVAGFGAEGWLFIAATTVLLFGYVVTWYAALRRAPATNVSAILVGGAVVTATLGAIRTGAVPAGSVVAGLSIIAAGVVAIGLGSWIGARRAEGLAREQA
ncbi:MAG TPA: DMT family transporter [Candidatus Limnocylindrales bacterium]